MSYFNDALELAKLGHPVFPVKHDKTPFAGTRGFKDASLTESEIRRTWRSTANIGISTEALAVLDVDGREGEATLAALEAEHGALPASAVQTTPNGGRHLIFSLPDGITVKNSVSKLGSKLDVRGKGGYIASGKGYAWERHPREGLTELPEPWIALLVTGKPRVSEGERNSKLTSVAGGLRRHGSNESELRADLKLVNQERCDPPLEDDEVETIAGSIARYEPVIHFTDAGNAQRLAEIAAGRILYHHALGWLRYDGRVWRRDQAGRVFQEAKRLVRTMHREATTGGDLDAREALSKHAFKSESRRGLEAMVALARYAEPLILDDHERLDADPFVLNTQNGIVDLRTGAIVEHSPLAYCSRITSAAYDPEALCPAWERLLGEWVPDEALRLWLQRLLGYAIHGFHSELFPILHGFGANGKSSLLDALDAVLGDYVWTGSRDLLIDKEKGTAGSESAIAQLYGRRLVLVRETRAERRLDESFVKEATGDFKLSGKYMRQDRFEFVNRAAIILATNHLPTIRGGDHGIWRRIREFPFNEPIPLEKQISAHEMAALLKPEHNGILRWLVDGAATYNRDGLAPEPEEVTGATERYRSSQDLLGLWFEAACVQSKTYRAPRGPVYASYCAFCEKHDQKPTSQTQFNRALENRGLRPDSLQHNGKTTRLWIGIDLRENPHD